MFCRVLEAKVQPGKMEQALAIFSEQMGRVKNTSGFLLAQAMQEGDDLMVVSSWRNEKDIRWAMPPVISTRYPCASLRAVSRVAGRQKFCDEAGNRRGGGVLLA